MNIHWPQQLRQNYYSAFYRWGTLRLPKVKTVCQSCTAVRERVGLSVLAA